MRTGPHDQTHQNWKVKTRDGGGRTPCHEDGLGPRQQGLNAGMAKNHKYL